MDILTSQLPSGGYGYKFPTISVSPMTFLQLTDYLQNLPGNDPLERYLYDINNLIKEDEKILDCYLLDVDFLIFYKKLCTVSDDLTYEVKIKCPDCGKELKRKVSLDKDIHFKKVDNKIMNGSFIELGGHRYETIVPTVKDFFKVFEVYLKYRTIESLDTIKLISLFKDFRVSGGNQIENDILGATHSDITLLMALKDLYFNYVEPIQMFCPECNKDKEKTERRSVAVSVESLIVDFFRDLYNNSPINGSKILFK